MESIAYCFGVNYFFGLTTTISPYRGASRINVTEVVNVVDMVTGHHCEIQG